MAYTKFDLSNAEKSESVDVYNKEMLVVKVKTGRWLLCEENGDVVASKRSSDEVHTAAAKIEVRRLNGNLHGFRFGKKIDESVVEGYAVAVWGERFSYENIAFDGHYWWCDIIDNETGATAEHLRADYHINYERLPEFAVERKAA